MGIIKSLKGNLKFSAALYIKVVVGDLGRSQDQTCEYLGQDNKFALSQRQYSKNLTMSYHLASVAESSLRWLFICASVSLQRRFKRRGDIFILFASPSKKPLCSGYGSPHPKRVPAGFYVVKLGKGGVQIGLPGKIQILS